MIDDEEFDWLEEHAAADVDHLLLATTLPYLLPPALHHLEAWNEAVCAGRRGALAARIGERIRQGIDLEHWAAFENSFTRLGKLLRSVASGRGGSAPASIVLLSGDVHHAYVSRLRDAKGEAWESAVYQLVSSPLRHPMPKPMQWIYRAIISLPVAHLTRGMAHRVGVAVPELSWELDEGPWFDNQIGTLALDGRRATFRLERSFLDDGHPRLETLLEKPLVGERDWPGFIADAPASAAR